MTDSGTRTRGQRGEGHFELSGVRGWHTTFWALLALAMLYLAVTDRLGDHERLEGAFAVAVLALAYGALLQRRSWPQGPRALAYLMIAVVMTGVASSVDPNLSMLLFIVYPQVWAFTERPWVGIAFAVALSASTLVGFLGHDGFTLRNLRDAGPEVAVALLFSVALGLWITQVVRQSMERAELIQALEAARSQLSRAEHARGVTAERERMAREIHDTLAQGFTSIVMLAQAASAGLARDQAQAGERLATIEDVARENLAEARALVAAFAPVGLENSTLPDALRRLARRFVEETGLSLDLRVPPAASGLSRDQEVVLLRAVQEALTNIRRHAGARHVVVRLMMDDAEARVEVGDDGVGFAVAETASGFGLAGMRGRVSDVGGALDVASSPGNGTRIVVQVPVIEAVAEVGS